MAKIAIFCPIWSHCPQDNCYLCFLNGQSLLFRLFLFFSTTNSQENCRLQQDSKLNHLSIRQACWPLEHHHGPFASFLKKWANPGLYFFIFVFSIQLTVNVQYNFLPMTVFEPRTSGIGSACSTNWATTTALRCCLVSGRSSFLKKINRWCDNTNHTFFAKQFISFHITSRHSN